MKKIAGIISICTASIVFAQIGINTKTPKATLDVTAKKRF